MEKQNKNTMQKKVLSRNRNKNKNKALQNRIKEREIAKKDKVMRLARGVDAAVTEVTIEDEALRDEVVVVPERKVVSFDNDFFDLDDKKVQVNDTNDDESEDDFIKVKVNKFKFEDEEKDNATSNKFNFMTEENEILEKVDTDILEDYHYVDNDNLENVYDDYSDSVKIETVEAEEIIPRPTENVDINVRKYISFEKRVLAWFIFIIITFFIAGLLIFKTVTGAYDEVISYDEASSISYNVCINNDTYNQYYATSCLDEGMEYLTSISERMPASFKYTVDYSSEVENTLDYYVVAKVIIAKEANGKILNTVEDVLVDRTSYSLFSKKAEFLVDVDIPIKKYIDYVDNYNRQFGLTSYATLDVAFYVDNGNEIKKVSALAMPISTATFSVERKNTQAVNQVLETEGTDGWGNLNTSYAVVGLIFVLFGLFGIIKLSNLVYKAIGTSSVYQKKLNRILREYDRLIVIARGEYTIDPSKKLVKVASFKELLDARDTLEKPIVYLKVNSVKSEFYVEDSEAIYKYTMKEADFGGK